MNAEHEVKPEVTWEVGIFGGNLDIMVTLDVHEFLKRTVEYDEELDMLFYVDFLTDVDQYKNRPWPELMEEFPFWLQQHKAKLAAEEELERGKFNSEEYNRLLEYYLRLFEPKGIYGDPSGPVTVNTSNWEDLLSSPIQYVYWEMDREGYALIQVHTGGDVRSGYSRPRAYRTNPDDGLFDNARCGVFCSECHASWRSDNGYNFYPDNGAILNLEDYEAIDFDDLPDHERELGERTLAVSGGIADLQQSRYKGTAVIVRDSEVFCPECGFGKLRPTL